MSSRLTRSRSRTLALEPAEKIGILVSTKPSQATSVINVSHGHATVCTGNADSEALIQQLTKADQILVRSKQHKLQHQDAQIHAFVRNVSVPRSDSTVLLAEAARATYVAAGEAAGTAICISSDGVLLTCAHCIAEDPKDFRPRMKSLWLTTEGHVVKAACVNWDAKRDLALLRIVSATKSSKPPEGKKSPVARIADSAPKPRSNLICIGHPGSEDMETDKPGVSTGYDVLHVSEGRFRGYAKGQDLQDNSDIGALMHDCWTYWGHSGAPLLKVTSGKLIGLHSSWDDETAMRRGVPWEAIKAFLEASKIPMLY